MTFRRFFKVVVLLLTAGAVRAQSPVTLTITNSPGYVIPADFNGLGFETGTLPGGAFFNATNLPLITLFQNLGIRNLRVGGGTSDGPTASIPGNPDIDDLFGFAQSTGNLNVIYSLCLHNGNSINDAAAAQYIWTNYRSQLTGFALGNEPDWQSAQSEDSAITNYTTFLSQWRVFATAITNAAPGATFVGPDTGGNTDNGPPDGSSGAWAENGTEWTTDFATGERSSGIVTLITQHHYVADGSPLPTIDSMLSPGWDTITNQTLYNVVGAPVLAAGLPYRLTEAEDCVGGVPGASDTFAGALWALDFMHWWAQHNCAGINFHNSRWKTNTVITVNNNAGGQLSIYPKGYGIKAFDLGGHGNEEPVAIGNPDGLNLTAYAVAGSTNLFVTIVNKEHGTGARAAGVTITLNGFLPGEVAAMYLTSSGGNIAATNGITLGGAIITNNAPWAGQWTALGSASNEQFAVTVAAASAAILEIGIAPGAPVIVRDLPAELILPAGKSYTYSPGVNGASPLAYQWYAGATPLAGQTNGTFTLAAASLGNSTYSVVITNVWGAVTSLVSTVTVVPRLTSLYATQVLGLGPAGYWPLQETAAPAPANMETNYGTLGKLGNAYYAATSPGVVAFAQSGALAGDNDSASGFSGSSGNPNSYAFVPRVTPALTLRAPFTLEAWVNPSSTTYGLTLGEGGGTGMNGGPNFGGWQMGLGSTSGNNRFQMQYYTGVGSAANNGVATAMSYSTGRWYHYAVTYDGTNSTMYVDGTNIFTAATANSPDTWSPLAIGAGKWNFGPIGGVRWLQGEEDEVAVYTNLLTPGQIQNHYLAGTSASSNYIQTVLGNSPLLYYRMDCADYTNPAPALCPVAVNYGSATVDGSYLSGTVPGGLAGPPIPAWGTNTVATLINGVFSCVDAGSDPSFNPTGTQPFTAMAWFRTYPADGRMQAVMSHGGNTSWALNLVGTNGTVVWNSGAGSVASTNNLNDGQWHFAAGVYNGTQNELYVDGMLNSLAPASGGVIGNTSDDVLLGGDPDFTLAGNNEHYFAGTIAQAAFFTQALTAGEIGELYSVAGIPFAGLTRGPGSLIMINYTGTLLASTNVAGPYAPVSGAVSPYPIPATGHQQFYRASNP